MLAEHKSFYRVLHKLSKNEVRLHLQLDQHSAAVSRFDSQLRVPHLQHILCVMRQEGNSGAEYDELDVDNKREGEEAEQHHS